MALGTSWGLSAKSCRHKLPPAVARPVALYPVCHNTRECGREQDGSGTGSLSQWRALAWTQDTHPPSLSPEWPLLMEPGKESPAQRLE